MQDPLTVVTTKSPTRRSRDVRPLVGWVYFLMGQESGRFKIGRAQDPEKRIGSIQTGCAEELAPWGVIPSCDPVELEKVLHRRFAKLRLRGEWFAASDEIDWFVERFGYEFGGRVRIWDELHDDPRPRPHPAFRHLLANPEVEAA